MKKLLTIASLLVFIAAGFSAQSLLDNTYYRSSLQLAAKSQQALDQGD